MGREVKHRGTIERKGENILGGMSPAREKKSCDWLEGW